MDVSHPIVGDTRYCHFSPLNELSPVLLEELLSRSDIERFPPGRRLVCGDDAKSRTRFLLSGQLALVSEDHEARMVRADSREACAPIDLHKPHRVTALARTSVTMLSVDSKLLAELLQRCRNTTHTGGAAGGETAKTVASGDRLFAGPLFCRLAPPHLQALNRRMTRLQLAAGDVLCRESDPAQFYYLIEEGRFRLSRRLQPRRPETVLMESGPGDGIGESGLIAHGRCGITATALEDSRVACITKGAFHTLLLRPHINPITYSDAMFRQQAGAVLLDVRAFRAFQRSRLAGGISLPLRQLQQVARLLDRNREYIVFADNPAHGATAAFLLACQGIESSLLKDAAALDYHGRAGTGVRGFSPLYS